MFGLIVCLLCAQLCWQTLTLYLVDISLYVEREETVTRMDRSLYLVRALATLAAAIHADAYVHLDDCACLLIQYDRPHSEYRNHTSYQQRALVKYNNYQRERSQREEMTRHLVSENKSHETC